MADWYLPHAKVAAGAEVPDIFVAIAPVAS
jgi:hypothetical protein